MKKRMIVMLIAVIAFVAAIGAIKFSQVRTVVPLLVCLSIKAVDARNAVAVWLEPSASIGSFCSTSSGAVGCSSGARSSIGCHGPGRPDAPRTVA